MQDRYAGDVGDFGKFSLLRTLFSDPVYRLCIVWYLYPDESHNQDGRHIDYLKKNSYIKCDAGLVKSLSSMIRNNERSVKALEQLKLLPEDTIYYSNRLSYYFDHPGQRKIDKQARMDARIKWLENAVENVSDCNVVFLDPDNGLEAASISSMISKPSGKYTYYSDVDTFYRDRDVCVIYHHLNRNCTHNEQIIQRLDELSKHVDSGDVVFAIRYKPYSPRAYFIMVRKPLVDVVRENIKKYLISSCGFGWDSYYEKNKNL